MPNSKGFTLVEVMIAIAILIIFATGGLVIFRGAENRAKVAKIQADFNAMSKQIEVARQARNQHFVEIIGIDYADEHCRNIPGSGYPMGTQVKDRPMCIADMRNSWSMLTNQPFPNDPWGNPYTFDANEYESAFYFQHDPAGPPGNGMGVGPLRVCRWDILKSAGRNGLSWDDDDYIFYVRPKTCTVKEECYYTPGTVLGGGRKNYSTPEEFDTYAPDCQSPT